MSLLEAITVPIGNLSKSLADIVLLPRQKKQGRHLDPINFDPPRASDWLVERREAWASPQMQVFRDCLKSGDLDVRSSVLQDLSRFYGYPVEECLERCLDWEAWSVKEWSARDRSSAAGLQDFYDTVQSWSFDLLWYAYLQSEGFGFPASVLAVRFALEKCPGGRHLDFGSGIGVTSQVFSRCGFTSAAADVSKPLLAFASWRFDQHGDAVERINLTEKKLGSSAYDIVTAVDTLVHVRDIDEALSDLHNAIRPGGWMLTNFDVRDSDSVESASHLHNDTVDLEYRMEAGGFRRVGTIAGVTDIYQRVDTTTLAFRLRLVWLRLLLPFRKALSLFSRVRMPTPGRLRKLVGKIWK